MDLGVSLGLERSLERSLGPIFHYIRIKSTKRIMPSARANLYARHIVSRLTIQRQAEKYVLVGRDLAVSNSGDSSDEFGFQAIIIYRLNASSVVLLRSTCGIDARQVSHRAVRLQMCQFGASRGFVGCMGDPGNGYLSVQRRPPSYSSARHADSVPDWAPIVLNWGRAHPI
jgi:hypothetical protein